MTDTDMVEPYSSTTGITFFGTLETAIPEMNIKSSLVMVIVLFKLFVSGIVDL